MRPDLETQRSRRGLGYHIRRLRRFAGRHRRRVNRNSVVWRAGPDRRPTEKSKRGYVRRPSRLRDKRAPATPRLPASIADRRWFSNDLETQVLSTCTDLGNGLNRNKLAIPELLIIRTAGAGSDTI